ncbi:ATP-binding protein [Streptomyces aureocirculatus]|uniref:ATP-binding protein n=1 Tax=Streptomyces aureocirculatus TaxID=67275 RepID=UPI000D1446E0|nr:ATP-binding protein [Streptomyces aureocirculatus]
MTPHAAISSRVESAPGRKGPGPLQPARAHFTYRREESALPTVVPFARHQATATPTRWLTHQPGLIADAALVVNELASNAYRHSQLIAMILLLHPVTAPGAAHLYVAVHDAQPHKPPAPHQPPAHAEHGRGLLLVDRLAHSHGTALYPGHKAVWARLNLLP